MSIESMMPSNHLILCRPLFLLPSIFPSIRVFSSLRTMHGGGSTPSCCAFIHRVAFKEVSAGRDWGQEEKGTTEDEMAGWHHRLDGHEFE